MWTLLAYREGLKVHWVYMVLRAFAVMAVCRMVSRLLFCVALRKTGKNNPLQHHEGEDFWRSCRSLLENWRRQHHCNSAFLLCVCLSQALM